VWEVTTVCTISYEPRQHRLRLAGACIEGDVQSIRQAIAEHGRDQDVLIVDVTGVHDISDDVARTILVAGKEVGLSRFCVLRKHDTDVDRLLSRLEQELADTD